MAFNRVTWNKLRKCAAQFCSYDDYNWDWSLQHIAQTCLPPSKGPGIAPRTESGLITMMMRAPRVFHIGEWWVGTATFLLLLYFSHILLWIWSLYELNFVNASGVHHKKTNCESTAVIAKVQNILKAAQEHLFPTQLTLTVAGTAKKTKLRKGNGGWGDTRDHRLCWNITVYPDLVLPWDQISRTIQPSFPQFLLFPHFVSSPLLPLLSSLFQNLVCLARSIFIRASFIVLSNRNMLV